MINFLCSISNNNPITFKVLRSFIQCVLLRDNQFQVALYLHGPGGTGKSTFEKLLTSLVGNTNSTVLNILDLNKQFTTSKILDKSLVLFSDVQFYTGDPSKLRLLISGDLMNAERKYKDSFDLQPEALVILSTNLLWSPKDSSTGLQRRFLYLKVNKSPNIVNRDLFNIKNNQCSGHLYDNLPGIINWVLETTPEELNFLNQETVDINHILCPGLNAEINPLLQWIQDSLEIGEGSSAPVGTKKQDPTKYLYPNYYKFCMDQGVASLSIMDFSNALLQQLSLFYKDIEFNKKRTKESTLISNIKLISSK